MDERGDNPQIDLRMAETEGIISSVFLRILNEPGMLNTFLSPGRDSFLQNLKQWLVGEIYE